MPFPGPKASPETPATSRKSVVSAAAVENEIGQHLTNGHDNGSSTAPNELNISGGSGNNAMPLVPAIRTSFMSGWLDRRTGSGLGKRWKKRFFVIEPQAFVEYRDTHGGATKLFHLREIADILAEDREKFTFGFRFGPARWISLRASSTVELDDWVSALRKAVIELGPPTPPPITSGMGSWRRRNSPVGEHQRHGGPFGSGSASASTTPTAANNNGDLMQRRGKDLPRLNITAAPSASENTAAAGRSRGHSEQVATSFDRRPSELVSSVSSISPSHLQRRSLDAVPASTTARSTPSASLQEATTDEEDEEDDEGSSSNSDEEEEDYNFAKHTSLAEASQAASVEDQSSITSSGKPKSTWGTSLKAFFRRATSESTDREEIDGEEEDSETEKQKDKKEKVFDVRTVQVVEYDVVEIFENQRWFPITNWGTKMLPHDRALWTNRAGHSRTDWYRTSLDPNDTIAVNTATLGVEDREETPGGQVHVIKDPWQWEGGWRLAPLLALNPSAPSANTSNTQHKDPFREGLKRDLRTGSLDSLTGVEPPAPATGTTTEGKEDSTHGVSQQPPPTPSGSSTSSGNNALTPHHGGGSGSNGMSAVVQVPQSGKHSMVKSLKRRFISRSSDSMNGGPTLSTTSSHPSSLGGYGSSAVSVHSAPATTMNHPSTPHHPSLHPTSMSELASLPAHSFDHNHHHQAHPPEQQHSEHRSDGWGHAFDFPDFDAIIARGVPRTHPPSNVRTRRWIRTRKRVVNVTGRLPDNILPFITSVLSFQRQVVAEGYLGVKGRAGNWRSKYYKLIRVCSGIWDGGLGEGLVETLPTQYLLVACECRELHQHSSKSLKLEPGSSARVFPMVAGYHPNGINGLSEEDSLVLNSHKFAPLDHGDLFDDSNPHSVVARLRVEQPGHGQQHQQQHNPAEEPSRSGRFEFVLNKDHAFVLNADSRPDALAWISALNRAASELQKAAEASGGVVLQQQGGGIPIKQNNKNNHLSQHHRMSLLRIPHFKGRKSLKDVAEEDEGDEEVEAEKEEQEEHLHLEDTGEDPVPNDQHSLPTPFPTEADSKLNEVIKVQLGISLRTFFQTFVGDKARFSIKDFHVEQNDTEVKCSSWSEVPPGGRSDFKDDFDYEGAETVPERLLTFRTQTGAPIGPKVTRVEKRQRYYYYAASKTLIIKTWAKSLDVPFGDAFLVMEKWIAVADKDDEHKVNLRVLTGSHFLKSVMLKGTIQSSIENGARKVYPLWKRKFLQFGGPKKASAGTAAGIAPEETEEEVEAVPQGMLASMIRKVTTMGDMIVSIAQTTWKFGVIVFVIWWMIQMLWVLQRVAKALEEGNRQNPFALKDLAEL